MTEQSLRHAIELAEVEMRARASAALTVGARAHAENAPGQSLRVGMCFAQGAIYLECADMLKGILS